jgi:hypothetical protein
VSLRYFVLSGRETEVELCTNLAVYADVLPFTLEALKDAFFVICSTGFVATDRYSS